MRFKKFFLIAAAAVSWCAGAAELVDTPVNLLKESTFQPVYMHGMVTAARGWNMYDAAREYSIRQERIYLSGRDCFVLSHKDNVFSIVFKKPLQKVYKKLGIILRSRNSMQMPPADHYLIKGKVKFKNGRLSLRPGKALKISDDWQEFEARHKTGLFSLVLHPGEGAEYHFERLEEYAVYPKIGGTIALPDGGKLEKILIPENATYEMRHGLALWRGWLWRLTGVALPIVAVKEITGPVEGALVALKGPEKPGNWSLKVNKNGVVISSYCDLEISNAIFDYLRRGLGCAFYQRDCQKIPAMGSVKQLTALDFTTKLMYTHLNSCHDIGTMQGGDDYTTLYTRNDVDYYHLPTAKPDHVFNVLVPQETYFKTNPEYFAKIGENSYYVHAVPYYTNHCLTDPGLRKLLLKNAVEYAKAQYGPRRLVIDEGDSPVHCQCERCVKFNGGTESCSNSIYAFHEELAREVAKVRPDLIFERHAYYTRSQMPTNIKKLPDNTHLFYCMGDFRCKLHVECEVNRKAIDLIKNLRTLVGNDSRRMSFMHYHDLRPLYMIKQMTELNKYGSDSYFLWVYKSYHPAIPFLLGRYNLGEDPIKLLKEFEEAYYGKGAPHVHRAFEITEEFAENYKHTRQEIESDAKCAIWPDTFGRVNTILDRKTLDRIYPCFMKALEAVGDNQLYRKHIYRDLLFFLSEDLHKFRPNSCKSDAEFKAYVDRLALIIRAGRECPGAFNNLMYRTEARDYLSTVTGVTIPRSKRNWADEPMLNKILREPDKYLVRNGEIFPGQGLYFKPVFFTSNFDNTVDAPPEIKVQGKQRDNMLLYSNQTLEMTLPMSSLSKGPVALSIEGVKETKGSNYSIEVAVNGHKVYSGKAFYEADKWSRMGFSIPPEALKLGNNKLTVKNTSAEGWIAVSEIYTIDVSGDFRNFLAGGNSLWRHLKDTKNNGGSAIAENGKVVIRPPADGKLMWYFFGHGHQYPKIAVTPGGKVRIRVTASGSGKIQFVICRYTPYGLDKNGMQIFKHNGYQSHVGNKGERRSKSYTLSGKPKVYQAEFRIPAGLGLIFPGVEITGSKAEISNVAVTVEQPESK